MSKIGRRPIDLAGIKVDIVGQEIHYHGKKNSGSFVLPKMLEADVHANILRVMPSKNIVLSHKEKRDLNRIWGLNRALLKNKIMGAGKEFELLLQINGLGYKVVISNPHLLVFSLGYSHKINFELPASVSAEVDAKTGQRLALRSFDNVLLGQVASRIRALKAPEPYKGTGVKFATEVLLRKPGKAKSSA